MIDTHEELLIALSEAAELEHSLICQYLYCAYSLKIDPAADGISAADAATFGKWREQILTVARQEMGHLGTVWNLNALIGGAAHVSRANFPQPSGRYYPPKIDFALTPFGEEALNRFIEFERPEEAQLALAPPDPLIYKRVGDLYRQIRNAVATLPEDELLVDTGAVQDQTSWSNNVTLKTAVTRDEALAAIDFIIMQGEGSPGSTAGSHFDRFSTLLAELTAHRTGGGVEPARRVVSNPITAKHRDAVEGTMLLDPTAIRAIACFNLTYRCLLDALRHYYSAGTETSDQHEQLKLACYRLMHGCLAPLGVALTRLPAGIADKQMMAGPSFELYGDEMLTSKPAIVWHLLTVRLTSVRDELTKLAQDTGRADFSKAAAGVGGALLMLGPGA